MFTVMQYVAVLALVAAFVMLSHILYIFFTPFRKPYIKEVQGEDKSWPPYPVVMYQENVFNCIFRKKELAELQKKSSDVIQKAVADHRRNEFREIVREVLAEQSDAK